MKRIIFALGRALGVTGRATIALVGICGVGVAVANYAVTVGSGTTFGSVVVGGIHYAQGFICDLTTPAQCASVSAGGAVKVDNSAVTQPVSAASGALVDGADATQGAKADAAWTTGSGSLIAIAKTIANNSGAAIPAGTNLIGKVGIDQTTPGTTNAVQANVASGGIASGAIASGAIASGAVASGAIASGAFAAGSFLNATAGDPCMFQPKSNFSISTSSGTTALVTGVSAKKVYVCSLSLIADTPAVKVNLIEGSSSTCGTSNTGAVIGSLTAANGMSFAANGGLTLGNGGGTVALQATAANYLCLLQSGTTLIAGNITYVQQ